MCNVPVKLKLFNYYCSSLYTPHLWWNYKKMSVSKLQISFHNILKRNIGLSKYDSTSATCAFTNTQCCQSTIRNLIFKFMCRLNKSDNALVKALMASSVVYTSRIKGALYIIQIICRRYTFWSYPTGLTIADPPGLQKLKYRRVYSHHFHTTIAESIHARQNTIQCPFNSHWRRLLYVHGAS